MHTKMRKLILRGRNALALDPPVAVEDEEKRPNKVSRHRDRDALAVDPQVAGDAPGRGAWDVFKDPLPTMITALPK
jgi:hypothetical protein